jgi:hypothetical protein
MYWQSLHIKFPAEAGLSFLSEHSFLANENEEVRRESNNPDDQQSISTKCEEENDYSHLWSRASRHERLPIPLSARSSSEFHRWFGILRKGGQTGLTFNAPPPLRSQPVHRNINLLFFLEHSTYSDTWKEELQNSWPEGRTKAHRRFLKLRRTDGFVSVIRAGNGCVRLALPFIA